VLSKLHDLGTAHLASHLGFAQEKGVRNR
jgi:hypothetical protein